jgi:thiamine monophosphate synthase
MRWSKSTEAVNTSTKASVAWAKRALESFSELTVVMMIFLRISLIKRNYTDKRQIMNLKAVKALCRMYRVQKIVNDQRGIILYSDPV